jgi:ABC-type sugar transport system ATPase subunit
VIELKQVGIVAGDFRLHDISFRIDSGEYAMLMGRTGCGKTTIIESICGLRSVAGGTIWLDGRDVTHGSPASRNIGYVSQDLALFDTMTVEENLRFAPRVRRRATDWTNKKTHELAELLGIEHLLNRGTKLLSGGEAQRVAIGRALAFEPPVLILDEPLSALDESTRTEMYEVLKRVQTERGVTTLHITHSSAESAILATQVLRIEDGKIISEMTKQP